MSTATATTAATVAATDEFQATIRESQGTQGNAAQGGQVGGPM